MNNQNPNNHTSLTDDDRRLELMLEVCRPEPIDNTRIKNLVKEKIMRDKIARVRKRHRIIYSTLSAAACLAILVVLGVKFIGSKSIDLSESTLAEAQHAGFTELIVAPGNRVELRLPDGSLLMANSGSRILYPEHFSGGERRIFAHGEVYLEVTKDAKHPFIVESEGFDVRVFGTTFNIRNSSDSTANVVLVEGSVEVTTDRDHSIRLKPNDLVDLVNGDISKLQQVDTDDYTAWARGLLALRGETLARLASHLSEHYGLSISCDDTLADVKVFGKLDLTGDVEQAMSAISEIVPMEVVREGNNILMKSPAMK